MSRLKINSVQTPSGVTGDTNISGVVFSCISRFLKVNVVEFIKSKKDLVQAGGKGETG